MRELSNNVGFAPSSDLAEIIPVSAFLYGMAMLGFIAYGLYLCIWTKKSNDPESATAEYFRQATMINVIFVCAGSTRLTELLCHIIPCLILPPALNNCVS